MFFISRDCTEAASQDSHECIQAPIHYQFLEKEAFGAQCHELRFIVS
jgi:hypothetical protein